MIKKYISIVCAGVILCGCTSTPSNGVMSCTSSNDNEVTSSTVTMELTYEDNLVISQTANTSLTAKSSDGYDQIKTIANNSEIAYKEIAGTTYQKTADEEKLTLEERITLDFKTISKEDLSKVISYKTVEDLNVKDIQTSLEEQGFTCTLK